MKNTKKITFDGTMVEISDDIRHETYDNDTHSGIRIFDSHTIYDLSYNKLVKWSRLIINDSDNSWKDLPFKNTTWHFLPKGVKISTNE